MEPEQSEASEPQPALSAFVLRAGKLPDLRFVISRWRRSYDSAPNTKCPGGIHEYIITQNALIEQCLASSELTVACPPERPEQILGWCCHRGPVVHFVFVKPYYQGAGIATALLRAAIGDARTVYLTHEWRWPHGEAIGVIVGKARTAGITVQYNPALIFGGKR